MIGKKLGMTWLFDEDGTVVPVTVIGMEPQIVVQKKTAGTDGYNTVQVAFGAVKGREVSKPVKGHFGKASIDYCKHLKESRTSDVDSYNVGDEIKVDISAAGNKIDVTRTSEGKGMAGATKRHHSGRGRRTHGSRFRRMPSGMGIVSYPDKVWKGHRTIGKMGNEKVTVQSLEVIHAGVETDVLLIKGTVPGPKKGFIVVKETVKNVEQSLEGGTECV